MTTSPVRGQVLVIVGLGMAIFIAMVGVVIDVGYAWGQQRSTQNGTDAAAHAGAVELVKHLAAGTTPSDAAVWLAVTTSAGENAISVSSAEYTDWQGTPLGAMVGPSDGNLVPANASGVHVLGTKRIDLFIGQIVGVNTYDIDTEATAVAGNLSNPCDTIDGCVLLPIAFPATMVTCTSNGSASVPVLDANGQPMRWPSNERVIMPMCGGNPGSVGWIDWDPPSGGTSETVQDVLQPPALDIDVPSWQFITATGNIDAKALEDAINTYAGEVVMFPLFDSTCNIEPTNPLTSGCPPPNVGGNGVNQWYHLPSFAALKLDSPKGAYTNGNNVSICDTGNGATDCLIGTFVDYVGEGTVGPPDPNSTNFVVQLIH
jgi:hypothetical protein